MSNLTTTKQNTVKMNNGEIQNGKNKIKMLNKAMKEVR